ncbi:hypothetical protein L0F63_000217 [Massospora cicadina]|nr:hypothetical protein L0F63_000217 [Massospora cicadina]
MDAANNSQSDSDPFSTDPKLSEIRSSPIGEVKKDEPMDCETNSKSPDFKETKQSPVALAPALMNIEPNMSSPSPMDDAITSAPLDNGAVKPDFSPTDTKQSFMEIERSPSLTGTKQSFTDIERNERSPSPMNSVHVSVPLETGSSKSSPFPTDGHSPVSMRTGTSRSSPSSANEAHPPVFMESDPSKSSPVFMGSGPSRRSPIPMDTELVTPVSNDDEPDKHGAIPEVSHTSSDDSFLDSSPALSAHQEAEEEAILEPMENPAPLETTISSDIKPEPMEDPLPTRAEEDAQSPAKELNPSEEPCVIEASPPREAPREEKAAAKPFVYQPSRRPAMNREELKQCSSILKALKRHRFGAIFAATEKKLNVCAYDMVDEFFADIQRIFDNCYLYNGYDAPVSLMAQSLQARFNELKANFSRASEILEQESALPSAQRGSGSRLSKPKPKQVSRKPAQPYSGSPRARYGSAGGEMPPHHHKFCSSVLKELHKKLHLSYSSPFLEPVDWEAMNLPDYPHIIKHPMDLSTVKKKFLAGEYATAQAFEHDIRLIFQNCFEYNPVHGQVYQMGQQLKAVFEKKWAQRPADLRPADTLYINDGLSSGDSSDASPAKVKASPVKVKEVKPARSKPPPLFNSAETPRKAEAPRVEPKIENRGRKRKESAQHDEPPPVKVSKTKSKPRKPQGITYEQKKELSLAINHLSGSMLNVVVDLIHRSMPGLGMSQNEIEMDIDALDANTLSKLYSYVIADSAKNRHDDRRIRDREVEGAGFKAPRRSDPQVAPSHKLPISSSSSSSSGSDSDSDSGSSALPKSSKTSSLPKSALSDKPSQLRIQSPTPESHHASKLSKPREFVEPAKRSSKPQPRESSEPLPLKAKRRPETSPKRKPKPAPPKARSPVKVPPVEVPSPPKKSEPRPSTKDGTKLDQSRLEAKKRRVPLDAQQIALRREKKQQREEEEARKVLQLKRKQEEVAFDRAQEDKRIRLAMGAHRKDLLYQNRLMRQYEDRMAHALRLEQSRDASKRPPPTSSVSPSMPNRQRRHPLEDGEIEEGELFE